MPKTRPLLCMPVGLSTAACGARLSKQHVKWNNYWRLLLSLSQNGQIYGSNFECSLIPRKGRVMSENLASHNILTVKAIKAQPGHRQTLRSSKAVGRHSGQTNETDGHNSQTGNDLQYVCTVGRIAKAFTCERKVAASGRPADLPCSTLCGNLPAGGLRSAVRTPAAPPDDCSPPIVPFLIFHRSAQPAVLGAPIDCNKIDHHGRRQRCCAAKTVSLDVAGSEAAAAQPTAPPAETAPLAASLLMTVIWLTKALNPAILSISAIMESRLLVDAQNGLNRGMGQAVKSTGCEPVRITEQYASLGLGKATEYDEYAVATTETRKALLAERMDEDEGERAAREADAAPPQDIAEAVQRENAAFYCDICDKQYAKVMEFENHLSRTITTTRRDSEICSRSRGREHAEASQWHQTQGAQGPGVARC